VVSSLRIGRQQLPSEPVSLSSYPGDMC
jgi:hypothetical protein